MRSVKELYGIKGINGMYEAAAVRDRKVNHLYRAQDGECYQLSAIKGVKKNQEFFIIQADGSKRVAYAIGAYRWSYSEEERNQVRDQEVAEEKAKREHRLLVERLAGLSTEQLKALVQEYGV
jgi:hypothetical protein